MDTIRLKMHLLKVDTVETFGRLMSMEKAATDNTELVKDTEKQIRILMKDVSKKENELDKMSNTLDKTEAKIKSTCHNLTQAEEDILILKENISVKEEMLRRNEEAVTPKTASLKATTAITDEAEKGRKELEHRVDFGQERIEKMEFELMGAKKTTRETYEKCDETNRRVALKEQRLESGLKKAEVAEKRVQVLEQNLAQVACQMGAKESSREKVGKREEAHKSKSRQLSMMLKEAESRASHTEEESKKLQVFLDQLKEEKDILQKMTEKKRMAASQQ